LVIFQVGSFFFSEWSHLWSTYFCFLEYLEWQACVTRPRFFCCDELLWTFTFDDLKLWSSWSPILESLGFQALVTGAQHVFFFFCIFEKRCCNVSQNSHKMWSYCISFLNVYPHLASGLYFLFKFW
jgi:hypothetical protein